jgi:predicted AlkP superfamily pyrophosphatase or phosphodiesterase
VLLVVLDAFGRAFLERHRDHPLVRRLVVTPLRSQFPSTTTAEMTTLYFGQAVESHGLYEWEILEPSLQQIICPLMWRLAAADEPGGLAGVLARETLAPGPTVFETLGASAMALLPNAIAGSYYTAMACAGARISGFGDLGAGLRLALEALAGECRYTLVYWSGIDTAGHLHGPASAEFAAASRDALDGLDRALAQAPSGITVLVTADHGQVDVDRSRVDYLDELWPQLGEHLAFQRRARAPARGCASASATWSSCPLPAARRG